MKQSSCRNLIKKPWAFTRVPYLNPIILGAGPVELNWRRAPYYDFLPYVLENVSSFG